MFPGHIERVIDVVRPTAIGIQKYDRIKQKQPQQKFLWKTDFIHCLINLICLFFLSLNHQFVQK